MLWFSRLVDILQVLKLFMMFAHVHTPTSLYPEQLDDYLCDGWFRMGQNIFTTNFLNFKGQFYSALWLRLKLRQFTGDNTGQKLRKLNGRFTVQFKKASITTEKEELFALYRQNITFEASASLQQLLFGKASHDIYDTYEVTVRDGSKLIACGFFDRGHQSAAGIASIYDPSYRKHSLGKYLIYQKINYCKEIGLEFFYPGYFVPGYAFFDYKLSIGKKDLEYLDFCSGAWLPINNFSPLLTPIRIMQERLNSLQMLLAHGKIESEVYRYEFFEAPLLPDLKDVGLFDFPLFLYYPVATFYPTFDVVVFDIREKTYRLIRCRSLWNSNLPNANGMFSAELLKEDHEIFSSPSAEEMATTLALNAGNGIGMA